MLIGTRTEVVLSEAEPDAVSGRTKVDRQQWLLAMTTCPRMARMATS